MTFTITWHDSGREPQCAPDPNYPEGKDLDLSYLSGIQCNVKLPYPARRCGYYDIECSVCGRKIAVTTAGRPDDPRSVKIGCSKPQATH